MSTDFPELVHVKSKKTAKRSKRSIGRCDEDDAIYPEVTTSWLYPNTKCSGRGTSIRKLSNKFYQEALTIIIYLVTFAGIALKRDKLGPSQILAISCNRRQETVSMPLHSLK